MAKKSKENIDQSGKSPSVTVSTLARLFNLTSVRVQQLAADGVVIRTARGKYDLWGSIKNYIKYLQERKVNQWDTEEDDPTELKKQQLRRTKEEADKLELLNAKTRGELVYRESVKRNGERVMSAMKTKILNWQVSDEYKDELLLDLLSLKDLKYEDEQ